MNDTALTSTQPNPKSPKRWYRFSISTLLWFSVIVAMGVAHWTTARDRQAMEKQFNLIREDHDLLEITDPTKIHVLPLRSSFHRIGQARVYLPEGNNYLLKFEWHDIPREKEPHVPYPGKELTPGLYLIDYAIHYEPMQGLGRWFVSISAKSRSDSQEIFYQLPWMPPQWLDAEFMGNGVYRLPDIDPSAPGGGRITFGDESGLNEGRITVFNEDDEVTLVQYRVNSEAATLGALINDPISSDDVFRIWIEKAPKQP